MNDRKIKIFFSGIAGSGISALACFMADKGNLVSGSDRQFDQNPDHPIKKILESKGIGIAPQDGSGIDETFDLAVFSTAVEPGQPEFEKAGSLGIPMKTRPEFLVDVTKNYRTIAVSGTSGKSTVSGMLAFLMDKLNLKPNFIGGGRVKHFRTPSNPGNSLSGNSDYLIIEACESDGTIIYYRLPYSIILNLSLDHHSINETAKMFETFMENTSEKIIMNADDENLANFKIKDVVSFSIDKPSMYRAEQVLYNHFSSEFILNGIHFRVSLPGRHNLYNALSCIALLSEIGINTKEIAELLPEFNGIERRFDIHLNNGVNLVIDDYAHNPHKISALIETVNNIKECVCYIFQPHGFGPVRLMKNEYIRTFSEKLRNTDHLILLPIYYAGGTVSRDLSSHDLSDGIRKNGRSVEVMNNRETILNNINKFRSYVVFGARDESLSDFAIHIADRLRN